MISAGKMRHRVKVANFTVTEDEFGAQGPQDYVPLKDGEDNDIRFHANIGYVSDETAPAGDRRDSGNYLIKMRYHPEISQSSRLIWRSRNLEIITIKDVENRRKVLEIEAREVSD